MTQYGYEPLSPADSGSTLLERINGVVPALVTNHKGPARPGYVLPGMMWIDDSGSAWLLNLYDGASDVAIAAINPQTHVPVETFVPLTRKIKVGSGLSLDGTNGADANPAEGDLSIDRLLGINLAAKALTPAVWAGGADETEAPISPVKLAATIAAHNKSAVPDLIVEEQKAAGSVGTAATAGAWSKRGLNTIVQNTIGATMSSSVVTLPAGTYFAQFSASGQSLNGHVAALRDTAGVVKVLGETMHTYSNTSGMNQSTGAGKFTLAATTAVELDHYAVTGGLLGPAVGTQGVVTCIFSRLVIWKVA